MDLKQLFSDEDAVSPVIGVILMVAITVILAAVIGTFVLGLGDQVQSSAPNANFQFQYGTTTVDGEDVNSVTITHNGGQDVDPDNVNVLIAGQDGFGADGTPATQTPFDGAGTIATGTSYTIVVRNADGGSLTAGTTLSATGTNTYGTTDATALAGGDSVRVVWTSPNGGSSNTIGQSTYPN